MLRQGRDTARRHRDARARHAEEQFQRLNNLLNSRPSSPAKRASDNHRAEFSAPAETWNEPAGSPVRSSDPGTRTREVNGRADTWDRALLLCGTPRQQVQGNA